MSFGSSFEDVPKLELAFVSPVKRLSRCERPGTSSRLPTLSMIRTGQYGAIGMRRRLRKFLPIVLIAMLVQIFAPISVGWALTNAAADPLAGAICSHATATTPSQDGPTDQQAHGACCMLCCAAHTATPTADPQASVARVERVADTVVWRDLIFALPVSATGSNAQARGPPGLS